MGTGNMHSSICSLPCRLPGDAELCRTAGNRAFFEKNWSSAIEQYTQGLHLLPDAATLYSHRAGAYLQRKWQGDAWLALQVRSRPAGCPQPLSHRLAAHWQCTITRQQDGMHTCASTVIMTDGLLN